MVLKMVDIEDTRIAAFGIFLLLGYIVSLFTKNNGIIFFLGFLYVIFILNDIHKEFEKFNEFNEMRNKKK